MTKLIPHNSRKLITCNPTKLIPHNQLKFISYKDEIKKRSDLRNIVDDVFSGNWLRRNLMGDTFKIDVEETENEYIIYAELPGIQKDEVQVKMNNEIVTISVNKKDIDEEKKNYIHKERYFAAMSRNIYLADVKSDGIKAKLADGLLTVTVQKQENPDNAVKIDIE